MHRCVSSIACGVARHALLTLVRASMVCKVDYCISVLAGVSGSLQNRLQSVLNAATRLVCSARKSEYITPLLLLRELHCSRAYPVLVMFLVYRCVHSTAPAYTYVTDSLHARRSRRSAYTMTLQVPLARRSTLGNRASPVAVALAMNGLPSARRAANSLLQFQGETKACQPVPTIVL